MRVMRQKSTRPKAVESARRIRATAMLAGAARRAARVAARTAASTSRRRFGGAGISRRARPSGGWKSPQQRTERRRHGREYGHCPIRHLRRQRTGVGRRGARSIRASIRRAKPDLARHGQGRGRRDCRQHRRTRGSCGPDFLGQRVGTLPAPRYRRARQRHPHPRQQGLRFAERRHRACRRQELDHG